EIFFKNDTGERIVLETAGKGDFFGEISLLDGGPRTASARVTKDLEAVVVDRGDLESFLKARPAAAMELLTAAGRGLRQCAAPPRATSTRRPRTSAPRSCARRTGSATFRAACLSSLSTAGCSSSGSSSTRGRWRTPRSGAGTRSRTVC